MLDIINIHKTFNKGTINEKVALDGVTLHLNEGDFCTIIGGNGAGKSTTLNAVAGVWPVDSGQILIDGVDVTGLPEHKRAKYLGRVFQDPMTGTVAAALDPKTAAKVLELSDKIIAENNLTALMVTHNMHDAIVHGNRLIMMGNGKVILDISGEEKKKLTVDDLLQKFEKASGSKLENDRMLLSKGEE